MIKNERIAGPVEMKKAEALTMEHLLAAQLLRQWTTTSAQTQIASDILR